MWRARTRSIAVDAQPLALLEIDEQDADGRVGRNVAEALEHAVAVVARKGERVRRDDPHESGRTPLVRAVGLALRIGARQEEEALLGKECAILFAELGAQQLFGQAIGDAPAVEALLQRAALVVIEVHQRNSTTLCVRTFTRRSKRSGRA